MALPIVSGETVRGYAAELSRDIQTRGSGNQMAGRDMGILLSTNPELYEFMMRMAEAIPLEERGKYVTGFLGCYALLQRQAEIDDLSRRRE